MLPYAFPDISHDGSDAIQSANQPDFEVLLGEMHAMLDRIADCWRADISANTLAVAGITSEIARSGVHVEVREDLTALQTGIGHILASSRACNRRG